MRQGLSGVIVGSFTGIVVRPSLERQFAPSFSWNNPFPRSATNPQPHSPLIQSHTIQHMHTQRFAQMLRFVLSLMSH